MVARASDAGGHIAALVSILVWGTTFISTKLLLEDFLPIEILFFRFVMGYIALWLVFPRRLTGTNARQELQFALAGLSGICLYYLLENVALVYTLASNVGVIISVAPFFTALLVYIAIPGEEKPNRNFFFGFVVAMAGICLISLPNSPLRLNPLGDFLAFAATLAWAFYSVFTRKISAFGYNTIQTTRRIFAYGLLWMLPFLLFSDARLGLERFSDPINLFNIIFLGLGASALCFVTWNYAVKILGAVKSSVYIYMVPVITVLTAVIVLHESIHALAAAGIALTLLGLFISEKKIKPYKIMVRRKKLLQ